MPVSYPIRMDHAQWISDCWFQTISVTFKSTSNDGGERSSALGWKVSLSGSPWYIKATVREYLIGIHIACVCETGFGSRGGFLPQLRALRVCLKGSSGCLTLCRQSWKIVANESVTNTCAPSFTSQAAFMAARNERMTLYCNSWLHQFFLFFNWPKSYYNDFRTLIVSIESASILQRVIRPSKG